MLFSSIAMACWFRVICPVGACPVSFQPRLLFLDSKPPGWTQLHLCFPMEYGKLLFSWSHIDGHVEQEAGAVC